MVEQFVVGVVRGTHGIAGELKVESTSGEYEHFVGMEEVTLTHGTESRLFKVEYAKPASGTLYLKLVGISTPEKAAEYNRWQIVVPRKNAHPLQEGEWYIEDLKGCSVIYYNGAVEPEDDSESVVGTVTDVKEGGSGYLVEISLSESCSLLREDIRMSKGSKPRSVFVPFNDEFIGTVDVERRKMRLMHLWILE